jgi:hypothetical protein
MKKPSSGGVSRRDLGIAIAAAGAVTSATAQQPTAAPSNEDVLTTAREQVRATGEKLRKFKVPLATEPSFTFRP